MSKEHIVELINVYKRFNPTDLPAIDDYTLGVYQGQILALLGPSGCGKTTI